MSQFIESFLQAHDRRADHRRVYGLMCVGLGLIFGIMRVINFAQGDFMMLGMYAAFYLFTSAGVQAFFGNTSARSSRSCSPAPSLPSVGYAASSSADLARHPARAPPRSKAKGIMPNSS